MVPKWNWTAADSNQATKVKQARTPVPVLAEIGQTATRPPLIEGHLTLLVRERLVSTPQFLRVGG
jgi:hypothetical protein